MLRQGILMIIGVLFLAGPALAVDPAVKCEAGKLKEAGKYGFCLLKAESKGLKKGEAPEIGKCVGKFAGKWPQIEVKAGGACPTQGDQAAMDSEITGHADRMAVLLSGGTPAGCGDGVKDGTEDCDGSDLGGETCEGLGFQSGALACSVGCGLDVSGCTLFSSASCPATGQITCWDSSGVLTACAGTGQDGEIQAGAALSYLDNGDGTITDLNTGLTWEKKSDDGSIHDKDTVYTWDNAFAVHVAGLNAGVFAGHTDWRVPNYKELVSILDLERFIPSVDPVFNTGRAPACTVTTCSCTRSFNYWSATSFGGGPLFAWFVLFDAGDGGFFDKGLSRSVRAVRGGL